MNILVLIRFEDRCALEPYKWDYLLSQKVFFFSFWQIAEAQQWRKWKHEKKNIVPLYYVWHFLLSLQFRKLQSSFTFRINEHWILHLSHILTSLLSENPPPAPAQAAAICLHPPPTQFAPTTEITSPSVSPEPVHAKPMGALLSKAPPQLLTLINLTWRSVGGRVWKSSQWRDPLPCRWTKGGLGKLRGGRMGTGAGGKKSERVWWN